MQQIVPLERFQTGTVAVVGLGKIGLPLAVQFALHHRVIGCDINPSLVAGVNAGICHVQGEPDLVESVSVLVERGLLSATCATSEAVRQAAVVVVIVPVAIDEQHNVDYRIVDAATASIGAGLQPGTLVIYETTLPVGTTSGRLADILERHSGLKAGRDFYLAYSPERVSSGSIFRDLRIYPKVVGGIDEASTVAASAFYASVLDASIIQMASSRDAELVKLIETTYRDVNIALANAYARFADACGLDLYAAIAAANSQPYSHIHTPGVGVGGHCIPVYPYFLLAGAEGMTTDMQAPLMLLRLARRINDEMATYAVQRLTALIGPLAGRAVLILGVAYRGNVQETAFTSAKLLREALEEQGAAVYVDDPLFSTDELRAQDYTPLPPTEEKQVCALILQTAHREYLSLPTQLENGRFPSCQVVLDGRSALQRAQIEALGIRYIAIGDGGRGRHGQHPPGSAASRDIPFSTISHVKG